MKSSLIVNASNGFLKKVQRLSLLLILLILFIFDNPRLYIYIKRNNNYRHKNLAFVKVNNPKKISFAKNQSERSKALKSIFTLLMTAHLLTKTFINGPRISYKLNFYSHISSYSNKYICSSDSLRIICLFFINGSLICQININTVSMEFISLWLWLSIRGFMLIYKQPRRKHMRWPFGSAHYIYICII